MTLKLVQIKGSNGSGKTTIVKQLLALDVYDGDPYLRGDDGTILVTVNPNVGWAAIGPYYDDKPMGGCDKLKSIQQIKDAIEFAIQWCQSKDCMFGVVFEGMMISTIKSTFYEFAAAMQREHGVEIFFVILRASLEGCLERIEARGTRRSNLNLEKINKKCVSILRHAGTYDQRYVRYIDVDAIPVEAMISEFLVAVGDEELLDYVQICCGV